MRDYIPFHSERNKSERAEREVKIFSVQNTTAWRKPTKLST